VDSVEKADLLFFVQSAYMPLQLNKLLPGSMARPVLGDGYTDSIRIVELRVFAAPAAAWREILNNTGLVDSLSIWNGCFFPRVI
jgi:hypothetical protein